jgi:hypothetical protein
MAEATDFPIHFLGIIHFGLSYCLKFRKFKGLVHYGNDVGV